MLNLQIRFFKFFFNPHKFNVIKTFQVALFQICVQRCSYLVDVITLENELTEEQWTQFFKVLFSESNAIKLGPLKIMLLFLLEFSRAE